MDIQTIQVKIKNIEQQKCELKEEYEQKLRQLDQTLEGGEADIKNLEKIQQLNEQHQNLQHELESCQNRMKYAKQKVGGARESLHHAQEVLNGQSTPNLDILARK